ncbi:hypothetical protein [Eleftheria terrae]|uniref:hypothetical protein n=1 Tax=Eleftheria terrae TaxID=1597781 RepID=UPI00263BCBCD|nr:hypothetical protein [Eleftheria terrae]WKB56173.1 PH domain-containing protein [Eleftheria terrae]
MPEMVLRRPAAKQYAWLMALVLVLPLVLTCAALYSVHEDTRRVPVLLGSTGIVVLVAGVLAAAVRRQRASFDGRALRIQSSFYNVTLRIADLASGIEVLDAGVPAARRLALRTNGVAFPGYRSGWFRSREGQKLFAAVIDQPNLYIPTKQSFGLVLSVENPALVKDELSKALAVERS